ncbi:TadE-like protein [Botrimarina colliarenosi]|uniref:TadE-like protein n=1 Tax=Botrimarina colliarenosi TaxID=2528001 RepID=A0A5C6AJN1_9BACT|nr:TadE/TadG family type IV pilus assembly protein [Botrimarina colliarenosi]TWT99616.1 TadE-like protein [Botrimarina colliarenosi]
MFRNQSNDRSGVAATEFAICLPVLMLLLLGTLESCSMIFLKQSLSIAAYEAGHTALLPNATDSDIRTAGEGVLTDRRIQNGAIQVLPGGIQSIDEGEYFEIRVSAPTDANRILPLSFFGGRQLSASAVFMKEI